MEIRDRVCVITGGASGIGAGLARRFAEEEAAAVVIADLDQYRTDEAAEEIGAVGVECDATDPAAVQGLVDWTADEFGPIDLFVSNAGTSIDGGLEVDDGGWQMLWDLHVMAHVYAARAVIPGMEAAGGGYLLQTVSAAGLLASLTSLPYTVTKTASLSLAEWLAITYRRSNIRVSALCPMVVDTPLVDRFNLDAVNSEILTPAQVAEAAVEGLREETFLILPHAEVSEYLARKADDRDRWLKGMSRLWEQLGPTAV